MKKTVRSLKNGRNAAKTALEKEGGFGDACLKKALLSGVSLLLLLPTLTSCFRYREDFEGSDGLLPLPPSHTNEASSSLAGQESSFAGADLTAIDTGYIGLSSDGSYFIADFSAGYCTVEQTGKHLYKMEEGSSREAMDFVSKKTPCLQVTRQAAGEILPHYALYQTGEGVDRVAICYLTSGGERKYSFARRCALDGINLHALYKDAEPATLYTTEWVHWLLRREEIAPLEGLTPHLYSYSEMHHPSPFYVSTEGEGGKVDDPSFFALVFDLPLQMEELPYHSFKLFFLSQEGGDDYDLWIPASYQVANGRLFLLFDGCHEKITTEHRSDSSFSTVLAVFDGEGRVLGYSESLFRFNGSSERYRADAIAAGKIAAPAEPEQRYGSSWFYWVEEQCGAKSAWGNYAYEEFRTNTMSKNASAFCFSHYDHQKNTPTGEGQVAFSLAVPLYEQELLELARNEGNRFLLLYRRKSYGNGYTVEQTFLADHQAMSDGGTLLYVPLKNEEKTLWLQGGDDSIDCEFYLLCYEQESGRPLFYKSFQTEWNVASATLFNVARTKGYFID